MVEAKIRREIENESIRREAIMSEIKRLKMGKMSLEERIAMLAEEKLRRRYGSQENGGLPFQIGNEELGFPEVRKPVGGKGKQKILLPVSMHFLLFLHFSVLLHLIIYGLQTKEALRSDASTD